MTLHEINEWRASKYCSFYEGIFSGIPSKFWKGAASTYALALVLLFVALLLAHVSCCRKVICGKSLFAIAGTYSECCRYNDLLLIIFQFNINPLIQIKKKICIIFFMKQYNNISQAILHCKECCN